MQPTFERAAFIVVAALLLMGGCYAWDNRDLDRAIWCEPSPAAWFFVALAVALLIYLTRKRA